MDEKKLILNNEYKKFNQRQITKEFEGLYSRACDSESGSESEGLACLCSI